MSFDEVFSVIVIGAGHAGCEAASAAARLGAETGLITLNLDLVGRCRAIRPLAGLQKGILYERSMRLAASWGGSLIALEFSFVCLIVLADRPCNLRERRPTACAIGPR